MKSLGVLWGSSSKLPSASSLFVQLRRSHFLRELERHLILVKSPDEIQQTCVADRISEIEMVISFFQDVGRFLYLTKVIVGSHDLPSET